MSYRPFVPGGECRSGVLIQPLQEDLQTPAELLDRRDGAALRSLPAAPVGVGEHMSDEVRNGITLEDIARAARVSRATASRALTGAGARVVLAVSGPPRSRPPCGAASRRSGSGPPTCRPSRHSRPRPPGVSIATAAATAVLAGAPVPPETWYRCELVTRESA
jgi:hypothetical protein